MKRILRVASWCVLLGGLSLQSMHEESEKEMTTLYCHGLRGKGIHGDKLKHSRFIHTGHKVFDFDDSQGCLGQDGDVEKVRNNIDPNKKYLMYGFSRGGATAVNYLAKYNPANVNGLVLDAAPHDMVDIFDSYLRDYGVSLLWSRSFAEWCVRVKYWGYPKNSVPPVQAIAQIKNKDLPVFIVHSKADQIVKIQSALENYRAFKQAGFSNVYLHELPDGLHARNASGEHSQDYLQNLHSFYQKHDLQHDAELADQKRLEFLQPTLDEINARFQLHEDQKAHLAKRTYEAVIHTRNVAMMAIPTVALAVACKKWR